MAGHLYPCQNSVKKLKFISQIRNMPTARHYPVFTAVIWPLTASIRKEIKPLLTVEI